jgi:hypothetical protein
MPLRGTLTRDPTDTYAGNFTATGLALRKPPMIGFKRAGVPTPNSGNRPLTAAITYPKLLMFEKSRLASPMRPSRPGSLIKAT